MRILHVIPNPFYIERGSLVRTREQILMARARGARCHAVSYHLGRDLPGVTIHRTPAVPWYQQLEPGANLHRLYLDLLLMITVCRVARRVRPDIIHAHLHEGFFAALLFCKWTGTPVLMDLEGGLSAELIARRFPGADMFKGVEKYLNKRAPRILTSSALLMDHMRYDMGVPAERLALFTDCIDTGMFQPRGRDAELAAALGIPPAAPVVVYLGSFEPLQGLDMLLEASRILSCQDPSVHFLIMGFPNEEHWHRRFSRAGVLNAHFPGRIDRDAAPAYLSLGTVAVSPKTAGSTQANGKLLDYMAMGLPVVAFDNPANREILGPEGCCVPQGDGARFADAIRSLLADPATRRRKGLALRSRLCREYSRSGHGDQLFAIYDSLISSGPRVNGCIRSLPDGTPHE